MVEREFLTNQFLIAMPGLADPNFARTVTYICEHNAEGAMGIVINRPLSVQLSQVLEQVEMASSDAAIGQRPVLLGGPVQRERGFVLHQPPGTWNATMRVTDRIAVTSSLDILEALASGRGPTRTLVALGYAGWGAGQLEQEMADNAWLSGPADERILFEVPFEQRWEAAVASLGIDPRLLSSDAGHA